MAAQEAREAQAADERRVYAIWPENWPAFELFVRCETQWVMSGGMASEPIGLNYPAVEWVAGKLGTTVDREMFDQIQAMELAVLEERADRAAREAGKSKGR